MASLSFWEVLESDLPIQNPTSEDKIARIGEVAALQPGQTVLDVACGKGGPALVLAKRFGVHVEGVDRSAYFIKRARERFAAEGLIGKFTRKDAEKYQFVSGQFDLAMCIGAAFVFDGLENTLAVLDDATKPGGFVAVGECFWKSWPLPAGYRGEGADEPELFTTLADTVRRIEQAGLTVLDMSISSDDERDQYEAAHWRTLDRWIRDNASHPDARRFREDNDLMRDDYLRWEREWLGWGVFVARKNN